MPERINGNDSAGDRSKAKEVDPIWVSRAMRTLQKACGKGPNPTYKRDQLYLAMQIGNHRVDHLRKVIGIALDAVAPKQKNNKHQEKYDDLRIAGIPWLNSAKTSAIIPRDVVTHYNKTR